MFQRALSDWVHETCRMRLSSPGRQPRRLLFDDVWQTAWLRIFEKWHELRMVLVDIQAGKLVPKRSLHPYLSTLIGRNAIIDLLRKQKRFPSAFPRPANDNERGDWDFESLIPDPQASVAGGQAHDLDGLLDDLPPESLEAVKGLARQLPVETVERLVAHLEQLSLHECEKLVTMLIDVSTKRASTKSIERLTRIIMLHGSPDRIETAVNGLAIAGDRAILKLDFLVEYGVDWELSEEEGGYRLFPGARHSHTTDEVKARVRAERNNDPEVEFAVRWIEDAFGKPDTIKGYNKYSKYRARAIERLNRRQGE